jgi:hypothetical protein
LNSKGKTGKPKGKKETGRKVAKERKARVTGNPCQERERKALANQLEEKANTTKEKLTMMEIHNADGGVTEDHYCQDWNTGEWYEWVTEETDSVNQVWSGTDYWTEDENTESVNQIDWNNSWRDEY